MGHRPIKIAKYFPGVDAQKIRWKNYKVWKLDLKAGSLRGPRCPGCRKRRETYRDDLCRDCYLERERKGQVSGPDHHAWKGGISLVEKHHRWSYEYRKFKKAVLKRDGYRCVLCGISRDDGVIIEVDHIIPVAAYRRGILEMSNARSLCQLCHKKTETYGNSAKYYRYLLRSGRLKLWLEE